MTKRKHPDELVKRTDVAARVQQVIAIVEATPGLSRAEIAKAFDVHPITVSGYLNTAANMGKVYATKTGKNGVWHPGSKTMPGKRPNIASFDFPRVSCVWELGRVL